MRAAVRIVLVALMAVLANAAAAAKRAALVFSAERYQFIRPLENPGHDADAVARALEALGFEVTTENNRDLRRMRRALDDFRADAQGAEMSLIFFAGHGVEVGGENRLLPVDADASSLERLQATSLPLNELREAAASGAVLIVLDACRNDPFGEEGGQNGDIARSAKPVGAEVKARVRPGLGRIGRAENTLIAFSAAPGETASDGADGNSPFSAALAKYLPASGLEIRSVLTLVQQEVYDKTGGAQTPYIESGLPKLVFAAGQGDLGEREALLLAMAAVTPDMRGEVEALAAERAMPMAPLFGALLAADLKTLGKEERGKRLAEAADAFTGTRGALKLLTSADPEVSRLRGEAEQALALGAFAAARAALGQAAALDAASGDALAGNLVARRLSEAATHMADAGVARTQLDYRAAIAAYEKSAALHEKVEREDVPESGRHERVVALQELGDLHVLTGDSGAALSDYRAMEAAARLHLEMSPGNSDAGHDLSVSLHKVGDATLARGDTKAALKAYEASLAIAETLAADDPGAIELQRDLAISHERIGDIRLAQGDRTAALQRYQASLDVMAPFRARAWDDADLQRFTALSLHKAATVQAAMGDSAAALRTFEAYVAIIRGLTARDAVNAAWQRDLSAGLESAGDMQAALDDTEGALGRYQESLAIVRGLAARDPGNAGLRRDLSAGVSKLGNMKAALGDNDAALAAYQEGLAIMQGLAAADPDNADWQRDLSVSYNKIGNMKSAAGDRRGAAEAYEADLAIAEKLAAKDPDNGDWQRDVIISHIKLAKSGVQVKRHLKAALKIAEAMKAKGTLAPADAWMPGSLRRALTEQK